MFIICFVSSPFIMIRLNVYYKVCHFLSDYKHRISESKKMCLENISSYIHRKKSFK
jgi:hypothetical protein